MSNYAGDMVKIDRDNHTVTFSANKFKKITGTRLASIVDRNAYCSEFEVACDICRLFSEEVDNKYTRAGKVIEPKIRDYVRKHPEKMDSLGSEFKIEEPIDPDQCWYNHFGKSSPYYRKGLVNCDYPDFGGMVDGYVDFADGTRAAVLEIKTAGIEKRESWFQNGEFTVPEHYVLQASLYCKLTSPELRKIVFAVGFLEEKDYEDPESWEPNEDNTYIGVTDSHLEIDIVMFDAQEWYNNLRSRASNGRVIVEWTPGNKRDEEVVALIEEFVEKQKAEFTAPFPSGKTPESMGGFSTADTFKGKDTPGKPRDVKKKPYQTKLF